MSFKFNTFQEFISETHIEEGSDNRVKVKSDKDISKIYKNNPDALFFNEKDKKFYSFTGDEGFYLDQDGEETEIDAKDISFAEVTESYAVYESEELTEITKEYLETIVSKPKVKQVWPYIEYLQSKYSDKIKSMMVKDVTLKLQFDNGIYAEIDLFGQKYRPGISYSEDGRRVLYLGDIDWKAALDLIVKRGAKGLTILKNTVLSRNLLSAIENGATISNENEFIQHLESMGFTDSEKAKHFNKLMSIQKAADASKVEYLKNLKTL